MKIMSSPTSLVSPARGLLAAALSPGPCAGPSCVSPPPPALTRSGPSPVAPAAVTPIITRWESPAAACVVVICHAEIAAAVV